VTEMERHLLVTVSGDFSALWGVRFVGRFFSDKKDLKVTLFYTSPRQIATAWERWHDRAAVARIKSQTEQSLQKGRDALDHAKKFLSGLGFDDEQVDTKLILRQYSKLMDIIQEKEKGLYDAIVLGKRGLTWLQETVEDSVSKGLLQQNIGAPVWICRSLDLERKNVLLCVDGSGSSYDMADHVGFMLAGESGHGVTLFHVGKAQGPASPDVEEIFKKNKKILMDNGFLERSIEIKAVPSGNAVKAILGEAESGRYGVVAVGRTRDEGGLLSGIFPGSVSLALFRKLEDSVLWVSRRHTR